MALTSLDHTHDPERESWVTSANGHPDFPLQNLPFGIFQVYGGPPRAGVAIGDFIFDVGAALQAGLFAGRFEAGAAGALPANGFLSLPKPSREAFRRAIFDLLSDAAPDKARRLEGRLLHPRESCALRLPAQIGAYTDFYCGIHHATNAGRIFRPAGDPLPRNYKYLPVAYNGRASSIIASGNPIRRPLGQSLAADSAAPGYGPSRRLDYELELGVWIAGGNELGTSIPVSRAGEHIAGFCLLNDWSARDIQAWEGQPLGPFLSKTFATSISPWIVTAEALAPFRCPRLARAPGDPGTLAYLLDRSDEQEGGLDLKMEAFILSPTMKARRMSPYRLTRVNANQLYWTFAQMVAHHTSNGCNLRPGDLLGSGTISSADADGRGSLLELTEGGRSVVTLPTGETRTWLEDGDEIVFTAHAARDGFAAIGFGECRGAVVPAFADGHG